MAHGELRDRFYQVFPDYHRSGYGDGPAWVVQRPGHGAYRVKRTKREAVKAAKKVSRGNPGMIGVVVYTGENIRRDEVIVVERGAEEVLKEISFTNGTR